MSCAIGGQSTYIVRALLGPIWCLLKLCGQSPAPTIFRFEGTHPALVALVALVTALAARSDRVCGPLTSLRQGEPHRLVALLAVGERWQGARGAAALRLPLAAVVDPSARSDLLQLLFHSREVSEALPARDGGALPVERARPHLTQKTHLLLPRNPKPPAARAFHASEPTHFKVESSDSPTRVRA